MKNRLLLVALFALVFCGTVLLLRELPLFLDPVEIRTPLESERRELAATRQDPEERPPSESGVPTPGKPVPEGAEAADAPGSARAGGIEVEVSASGLPAEVIGFTLTPNAGRVVDNLRGRLAIDDLPPGHYQIAVWTDGHIAAFDRDLQVKSGAKIRRRMELSAGIRPKGTIVDAQTSEPVAGALINFNGHIKVRSDSAGRFQAANFVPREALAQVEVSHVSYDEITYTWPAYQNNSTDMLLAVTRGNCRVEGRIVNKLPTPVKGKVLLKLFLDASNGRVEKRRELRIAVDEPFVFDRVHEGIYALHAEFEGSAVAAKRYDFLLEEKTTKFVEIVFEPGVAIEAKLLSRGARPSSVKVELLDEKAIPIVMTQSDAEGFVNFEQVPAGKYRLKVWMGLPWFNTEEFSIDGKDALSLLEVDCDRRRLKAR